MPSLPPPDHDELEELGRLHHDGQYLDAYRLAENFCAPEEWPTVGGRILAGRLFSCWGDWSRSNRVHQRSWRDAPHDAGAVYFCCLTIEHKHGPFEALRFLHDQRAVYDVREPERYHLWLWLQRARLLAIFRDFESAELWMARAETHAAGDAWLWVEKSRLRERQDRYDEALAAAEHALALRPNYRQSIETLAHLLMLRNRDDEALALLRRGVGQLQAGNLAQMLAILLGELERHEEVLVALDRAAEWLPCADRSQRMWLAARRSDALRALGRDAEAAEQARRAKNPFQDHLAARLEQPAGDKKRVHLRVPFVRQHHMTCAPATLAAIAGYWQRPADHLELARLICYDGTPDHEERHWAESHGWIAREFRVTWDAAVALLERGCPFTLTTVFTRSAHLQAVVGFDARLELLLIRDPYQRTHGECIGRLFLESAASYGPRGMVLVPPDRAALLDGIELPDAALYDRWYALRRALVGHNRDAAQREADALHAAAPEHRLSLSAQRELAFYDGNLLRQLETTRALLKLFPEEPNLLLDEAQTLHALGHAQERRHGVEKLALRRNPDPLFLREYAEILTDDARTLPRAHRVLRRILRRVPVEPGNLRAFANWLWSERRFEDATEVYRLAACVGDKLELHWDAFFTASRHARRVKECLELLRQREARLGAQSSYPARTLFRAYDALDRTKEGFDVLAAAMARRPDDGELALYAAEHHGRYGQMADATRLLAAAAGRAPRWWWLRAHARLAEFRADHASALEHWRAVLELSPLDIPAHGAIATLVATLEGRPAALDFLRQACARHPHQVPLHNLLLEWLRSEPAEEALKVVEHLLSLDPANAWALREKALILRRSNRFAEALAVAEEARRIEPLSPYSIGVHGLMLAALNRTEEAHAAFRDALRLAVDSGYMDDLLGAGRDFEQRKSAVLFLEEELARQPTPDGGAFLRYREIGRAVLAPAELRASLEKLLGVHPTNWGVWSALCAHTLDQGAIDEALARAQDMAARFPLVPRVWLDLAAVQSRAQQPQAEIESLRRALELSPAWGHASRTLADAHERSLELDAAEHVLRRAVAADPLDAVSHAYLGDLLWRRGRQDEAVALLERALTLEPGYEWAWQRLDFWSRERNQPQHAAQLAESIARQRPGDSRAWTRLARLQTREPENALATLEQAVAIDPRHVPAHDLRAELLVALGRHDAAFAACRAGVFGDRVPHELEGRAAWVEHERGAVAQAIERLRAVVSAHPDYTAGWGWLTEWYWETGEPAKTAEAAAKWSWLTPDAPVPHGYMAAAQQRMGNRRQAKDAYWRALHCSPAYSYGAQMLLQMLAEDRELEEAARVLRHIETHLSAHEANRAAVFFHVMRKDKPAACAALSALALAPAESSYLFDEAVRAFAEAGWQGNVEETLRPLLGEARAHAQVGRAWVGAWASSRKWRKLKQLEKSGASEPVRRSAWSAALEEMAKHRVVWRLRWHVRNRGPWLRRGAETWGSVGYAFVTADMFDAAIRWMRDWRERTDAEAWMLHNLALAFFQTKEPDQALEVVNHALTLKPDGMRPRFLIWRGIECALRGDAAGAADALARSTHAPTTEYMKLERAMLTTLVEFEQELLHSKKTATREAGRKIKEHWAESPNAGADTALVHLRARVLRYLGRRTGSWLTVTQSYLPPSGRRYGNSTVARSFGHYWWLIWVFVVLASSVSRSCS